MIKNKFFLAVLLGAILYISVNYTPVLRQQALTLPLQIKHYFLHVKERMTRQAETFFSQKAKIAELKTALEKCTPQAQLSTAFASRLNHFLEESRLKKYDPRLILVQGLSYVKLGDFSRLWLDFPDFNSSKIYGLLYRGYAAGIVDAEAGHPVARLLSNDKMVCSVRIGAQGDLGVLFGGKTFLSVKYIPSYAEIKRGDEVTTSGNDNIFYEGVKVGKVVAIESYNLYKTAAVEPYARLHDPHYFYAVDTRSEKIEERNATR